MANVKITNGYDRMPEPDLLTAAYFIHSQISSRTSVFTTPSPTMTAFKEACDEFQLALNAAKGGDKVAIGQKNVLRTSLLDDIHQLAGYIQMVAKQDPQVVLEAGFVLAKPGERIDLAVPETPDAAYTGQTGELDVKVKTVKGARAYLFQYTTDAEMKSWTTITRTTAKCKLTGLVPGTLYYLRVGVIGGREQERFSNVVTKMAF